MDATIAASSSSAVVQVTMFIHQLKQRSQVALHSALQDKASSLFSSEASHLKTRQTGESIKVNDIYKLIPTLPIHFLFIFCESLVELLYENEINFIQKENSFLKMTVLFISHA